MRSFGLFCALAAAAAIAGCASPAPPKLAAVAALPAPSLPPWIASVSPIGKAQTLAQIRIIFAKPLVPVTALSGAGPRDVLSRVAIEPPLRGHFAVLTPRMIGFVAEQALPIATRVRVTLGAGLRDVAGDTLDSDLAWTFETAPLSLTGLPQLAPNDDESTPSPAPLQPKLAVTANAALDTASLATHAALVGGGERVGISAAIETQPTPLPGSNAQELFDPSLADWVYDLKPVRALRKGTIYALVVDPGVEPLYGNVATATRFDGSLRTFGALEMVATPQPSPDSGNRFAGGDPVVAFTNPLDPSSVAGAVTISPSPAAVKTLVAVPDYRSNAIVIDPYALDPNASYTATIAAGVKDVFGQRLGRELRVPIRTSDFAAGAWAPSGTTTLIPAGIPVALNFYATNLPQNRYQAAYAVLRPSQLLGTFDPVSALPPYKSWPVRTLSGARRNVQSVVRVPIASQLGGPFGALAYGFRTALDPPDSTPGLTGIVQLTNLGVFSQWFPTHGIVLVQHLSDGAPVRGASVTVYRVDENGKVAPQECAAATTGGQGEADFTGIDVERCSVSAQPNAGPDLGVVVRDGGDAAAVTTWSWSGIGRFAVYGGWASGAPLSRGTIFSDRQMYQPGESCEMTGVAYYVQGAKVVADAGAQYRVSLTDPTNNTRALGTFRTDAFGVFSVPMTFSKEQPLGYYTVDAKGANGNEINGSFRVAEFKPPNFKLTLTLNATAAPAGSGVTAKVDAAYLFGAPLQGGTAHAYVTRDLATLQPKGWDDYSFGPQWYWPEQAPSFDTDVLQRDLPLDAQGSTSLDVAVPRDLPFPMTYRVDMETSDVSNLSVADSKSFLALPADAVIGLASDAVGKAGAAMTIRTIVTDADGKPVAGRSVHLELQKMTYVSATQEVEGGESAQQSVRYDTVASADVASVHGPVATTLTPPEPGAYRIFANFAGARGAASASTIQVFAFGAGEADWGEGDPNAVAIKLDKSQYSIGDTATALIGSPYAKSDVYFAVVRNDTLYRTTLRGVSGAVRVSFKVTPAMLPNAAVQAVVVHRGALVTNASLATLALTGMTALRVDVADRYLKIAIDPQKTTVAPGTAQRVSFAVTRRDGTPVRGELVAMVVNDAILQLSGYRLPDLVQTVFAAQPISTVFADNRENVTLKTATPPLEKGFGYGGGFLAGAASTRVRANFRPLAYYGVLRTDASGRAAASFAMPDDLTTWRVMAVALEKGTVSPSQFATADATFVSTQPLVANPLLPQFARPGDSFDMAVSLANQTGAGGALDLLLELTGALRFERSDQQRLAASEQAAAGVRAFRYPVVAGTPAPTTFQARAALGSASDAFEVPFSVSDRETTDSVIESGATRAQASIPIALSSGGTLQVTLANSVVPQFVTPSQAMMTDDAFPLADESAARLTIAAALGRLQRPYRLKLDFDPAAAAARNLDQLLSFQRDDGGFGEYSNAKQSDPFATAAAVEALAFARANGVPVDSSAGAKAGSFLERVLANPGIFRWCATDALCKAQLRFSALWALAATGQRRLDFLSDIVAQSRNFDTATQIRLARYLLRAPEWQSRGAAMAAELQQSVYLTGRYATANLSSRWSWLGSIVQAQAQMLQLSIERRAPPEQLDGAVRALVAQQCRCGWPTTDDTAAAVTALSAYAARERLAPSTATVTAGGTTIGSARFGATASSQTFGVAASSLRGSAIAVTATGGTVHYLVLYTYPVPAGAPGEVGAFRVIRTLSDPSAATSSTVTSPLATMDFATALPVSAAAGRVFDIGIRTIVDHPVDRLVIDDPLPAGFEAVDTSFRTALQAIVPQSDSWQIDTRQIYRDRVVAYASHLDPGVYEMHYLVRSVTPGNFAWPGARVYLKDAPEEFGRSSGTTLHVVP